MALTKCYYCGATSFLETFEVPWWSEISATDAKGNVVIKWKDQLTTRKITLCRDCSATMANYIQQMDKDCLEVCENVNG